VSAFNLGVQYLISYVSVLTYCVVFCSSGGNALGLYRTYAVALLLASRFGPLYIWWGSFSHHFLSLPPRPLTGGGGGVYILLGEGKRGVGGGGVGRTLSCFTLYIRVPFLHIRS